MWELIGYLGSALVLVSLLMSSIIRLRVINAVGSLIFCIYAFKINSIPTAIMNICLVGIDLFFLFKLIASKKAFALVETTADDSTVRYILDKFSDDVSRYFDSTDISGADRVIIAFDNETVAGVLAGVNDGDALQIIIDYTTPQYRDCSVAKYICAALSDRYRRLIYSGSNPRHIPYVLKMGYVLSDGVYVKEL